MDTPSETATDLERPKKGDTFQVLDTPEIRGQGGLAIRDYTYDEGVFRSGAKHMEGSVLRLPVGATITATAIFKDEEGVWATFQYPYQNPLQGYKVLDVCVLIEKRGLGSSEKYMEKVQQSAGAALDELKQEIEAARRQA